MAIKFSADEEANNWLSLIEPPRLIQSTNKNDTLTAQADGDIVWASRALTI